jgi:copper homeostasis protein
MPYRALLEICVESFDRAVAAERGGADRIELCADLAAGGVTPSVERMQSVRREVRIPIHVLIRPRLGDFVYSKAEFERMKREIGVAKDLGMDGIVLGLLDEDKQIDQKRTSALIKLASPLPVTFHRAFDLCPNFAGSLQSVIDTGAERILTSGGKTRASTGLKRLAELVAIAGRRIVIMPGGGVRANNIEHILRETAAPEVHSSLETARKQATTKKTPGVLQTERDRNENTEFEARVCELRRLMEQVSIQSSSR